MTHDDAPDGANSDRDQSSKDERDPLRWEDPRKVLARHGLAPKRAFSQNFLVAQSAVDRIAAGIGDASFVLELGPGVGTLTTSLARRGLRVHAIEKDPQMLRVLASEFSRAPAISFEEGDATTFSFADACTRFDLPRVAVAGNLPYAVTGSVFRNIVDESAFIDRAVLMIQREVRDRLIAEPGTRAWGALTVFVQNVFDVRSLFVVSAGSFFPPPKVESAVVLLVPRGAPRFVVTPTFERLVRAVFDSRRKTLRNSLRAAFEPDRVDGVLEALAISPTVRGETLPIEELGRIATALAD
jgi:16S rRNA (adenine1518-N6/adenine1519-N6)-dimethyltransferase